MNEVLKVFLSLSLSGTLLIIVLSLCKPLFKNRLSNQWQYYIWIIVIARLLLPFAPETNLMQNVFPKIDNINIEENISTKLEQNGSFDNQTNFTQSNVPDDITFGAPSNLITGDKSVRHTSMLQDVMQIITQNLWLIWLVVAMALLIRKITIYQSFVNYIKAGQVEISDIELWERLGKLMEQSGVKRIVRISTNPLISSPLLIGFFRPYIILPTTERSESDFQYTILHELTHFKRGDMFYKWLVQLTICLHWFNPFVYLMGREVNRACELSCDEAVIRKLDTNSQQGYGDTLLNALGTGGSYKDSLASVTLAESKELLKERLDAIMKFKKKSLPIICITFALTVLLLCGFTFIGAYTMPQLSASTSITSNAIVDLPTNDENITHIKGDITVSSSQSNKKPEIIVNIPDTDGDTFVKSYGKYHLDKDDYIFADITWKGEDNVMFLYTQDVVSEEEVINLVDKGILPLSSTNKTHNDGSGNSPALSSNFTYIRQGKTLKLNFSTNPYNSIYWSNKVPDTGNYYIYVISTGNTGISEIQGSIAFTSCIQKGDKLPRMTAWDGLISEDKKENGVGLQLKGYVGDKVVYEFFVEENDDKTVKFNSFLTGDFDIVFVDSDRNIIETIPSFRADKEATLTNLPKGKIEIIVYANNISGSLYLEMLD